ncbi:helix-turn-helix domain-containing protein [Arthrobacter sp. TMN-49]
MATVELAMTFLASRPNRAARALKNGPFKSIGVIVFTLSSFGNNKTLDAVVSAAADAGYSNPRFGYVGVDTDQDGGAKRAPHELGRR